MADNSPCKAASYDIVVVGGGTAGCVLATRLSEIPSLKIMVLEAGGNHNNDPRVKIPALFPQAIGDPNLDWNYRSVPQSELNGKEICAAQGKGFGGSSLINLLGLVYPSKVGFDAWSDMGNPGWDWVSMKPYLKKFQTFHMPGEAIQKSLRLTYVDESAQGQDGPIQASYQHEASVFDQAWVETFHNMGYPMRDDTISGHSLGGYQITSSIDPKTRERSHAGKAYLDQTRNRPNVEVVGNVLVEKITFTNDNPPRISEVRFIHKDQNYSVKVDREIILCGGAFGSPNLLERSGIGQGEVLRDFGIPVLVQNENVGENLQDHIMTAVSFELKDGFETIDNFRDPSYVQTAMAQYQQSRTGPLAGAYVNFAYMPLLEADKQEQRSRLQELIDSHFHDESANSAISVNKASQEFSRKVLLNSDEACANITMGTSQVHLEHNTMAEMFGLSDSGNYISIFTALAHPLSRGNVHIISTSASEPPRIDYKYYSHPLDAKIMVEHVQDVFPRIISTSPLADMLKPDGRRIPQYATFSDPKVTDKLIRESSTSNLHPCGTCAMLPRDQGGVVDSRLNCYGVKGLRVIDASIMPIIPRGNIMSCVYALAEKGADIIKEDLAPASQ